MSRWNTPRDLRSRLLTYNRTESAIQMDEIIRAEMNSPERVHRQELQAKVNIVQLIGQYTKLETISKTGNHKQWHGPCPFCGSENRSFKVNSERGYYTCRSCGEGGDIFTFVQKKCGVATSASVVWLEAWLSAHTSIKMPKFCDIAVHVVDKSEIPDDPDTWDMYKIVGGVLHLWIGDTGNSVWNQLLVIHALVERLIASEQGVTDDQITAYDLAHPDSPEPGDEHDCIYRDAHSAAVSVERMILAVLGKSWKEFDAGLT